MKILAIRGKNLASLEGEFGLEFTAEPLRSAGIFAITGCTGAGKSTLLDALCLALFDCTPRMNKAKENNVSVVDVADRSIAQNDSRSILRRGTSEGWAEVDFMAQTGETFRSRWMVRRSRGKVYGSLQKVEMSLVNLTGGVAMQGTKTELLQRITGLIGLSFDQFSRSVLLAQGDFATFLKARQTEKAEILEKLTGTEVYSRISTSIYEHTKRAESDYKLLQERIKGIELLSEEELERLFAEKEVLVSGLAAAKLKEEQVAARLKWLDEAVRLDAACHQAEVALASVRRETDEARPRHDLLARIERAQEIRDVFMERRGAKPRLVEVRSQVTGIQALVQKNAEWLVAAADEVEKARKVQEVWKSQIEEQEPLLNQAKELDVRLAEGKKQLEEMQKEIKIALQGKQRLEQAVVHTRQKIKQLTEKQEMVCGWFAKYAAYSQLVPVIELVTSLLVNLETVNAQIASNRVLLEEVKKAAETEEGRFKLLQEEAERLNRLLPAEVVLLRSRLQEGMPCPVCGSTHHPFGGQAEVQSLQEKELNDAKERVAKEMERLEKTIDSRRMETARLATLIGSYEKQLQQILEKVEGHVSILPSWRELLEKGTLKHNIQQFGKLWNERLQEQADLKEALSSRSVLVESLKGEWDNAIRQYEGKQEKGKALQALCTERKKKRASLLGGETTEQVVRRNNNRRKEIDAQLQKAVELHHGLMVQAESYKGSLSQMEQETARLSVLLQQDEAKIAGWLVAHQETEAGLDMLLSKDKAWIIAEKQTLDDLKERETSMSAVVRERRLQLEGHFRSESRIALSGDGTLPVERRQALVEELAVCVSEKEQRTGRLAQIEMAVGNHLKGKQRIAGFEKELAEKTSVYGNWAKLNELFGSQTGAKFKEIAQGYTLDVLLLYANRHLQDLAPRYELQRVAGTLALQIIDKDMMGEIRSVHSLSGGESFLVSLALALGLSSLSSNRMNVESLFIDEGFGSLDMDTLRIAMDALERLQMQGRKIGVISHVEEMTERISAQIRVVKTGNGQSRVQIVGG